MWRIFSPWRWCFLRGVKLWYAWRIEYTYSFLTHWKQLFYKFLCIIYIKHIRILKNQSALHSHTIRACRFCLWKNYKACEGIEVSIQISTDSKTININMKVNIPQSVQLLEVGEVSIIVMWSKPFIFLFVTDLLIILLLTEVKCFQTQKSYVLWKI